MFFVDHCRCRFVEEGSKRSIYFLLDIILCIPNVLFSIYFLLILVISWQYCVTWTKTKRRKDTRTYARTHLARNVTCLLTQMDPFSSWELWIQNEKHISCADIQVIFWLMLFNLSSRKVYIFVESSQRRAHFHLATFDNSTILITYTVLLQFT